VFLCTCCARTTHHARAHSAAIYFVHTSAKEGVDTIIEARAQGVPIYGETLHQYCCFNAERYKQPRGFCSHTYPSLKFPEDQVTLWDGLVRSGFPTLATDEYPTTLELKLRGKRSRTSPVATSAPRRAWASAGARASSSAA